MTITLANDEVESNVSRGIKTQPSEWIATLLVTILATHS